MSSQLSLSPAQRKAADALLDGISVGGTLVLSGDSGCGKTAVLKHLHDLRGGALIGVREFLAALVARDPNALEEAFLRTVEDALYANDLVLVDDLHLITNIVNRYNYQRQYLLDAALTALLAEAGALNKTMVFALNGDAPWSIGRRAFIWELSDLTAHDCGTPRKRSNASRPN